MKLFAPKNDWNMASPAGQNWFNMGGTVASASGVRIDEKTAELFSTVVTCTRVISETLASLPCTTLEQVNTRTSRKATAHPLWSVLHDQPTPEQDIMSWMDSQVAFQLNWGNAYAEIQRNSLGDIIALWPIHPSRIPLRNIRRNGMTQFEYDGIVGKAGELIYFVNNDDATTTPIPASEMLHVPGVMSTNGVTGQSLIRKGANAIGNAIATEQHAGMLFRNGAVTNMVIKSPKTVGVEASERLRNQWQNTFGGVQNHYKTLLLEEGMDATQMNMDPLSTQLIEARRFSGQQITGLYRVPPHLAGDLSQAIGSSNVESQGLSFVVYTMLPWIVRWEKAMRRQLLNDEEKQKYQIKFNVNGLLRGDQAARAMFYEKMFNLGAYSPNDIREKEDENSVDGGDQYFVQGNNCVPLDKIGELTQANIDKAKAPAPQTFQHSQSSDQISQDPTSTENKSHLAELRRQMVELIAEHENAIPDKVAAAVNLRSSDEAQRLEAKAIASLVSVKDAIRLAIQGEADQLMRYEARAAKEAAKKPQTFLSWRDEFYPKFTVKLATAISIFSAAAEAIGVSIDGTSEAAIYVKQSVAELDRLADLPCDQLEVGVDQLTETWANRPKQLAESLFIKGIAV